MNVENVDYLDALDVMQLIWSKQANQIFVIKINQKLNQKMINKFGTREKGENWKK